MIPVKVKNIEIGTGIPKICVPDIGKTKEEILSQAQEYKSLPMDILEWRADWFEDVSDTEKVLDVLKELRAILPDTPLLFTFRTKKEGGVLEFNIDDYTALNIAVANCGLADLIDVEIFTGDDLVKKMIDSIHASGTKVIASNHDFDKTPAASDLVYRMRKMQDFNADILKIAMMPQNTKDVITLLSATEEMKSCYSDRPLITMSMAGSGSISRVAGEFFGSAVTFGAGQAASAPGQLDAVTLSKILKTLHTCL